MICGKVYGSDGVNCITTDMIPNSLYGISTTSAMMMRDEIKPGTYIGVLNQNNLSEINIYQKNEISEENTTLKSWDGVTSDTTWYTSNAQEVYEISNGDQLRGLAELVESGETFEGKLIRLGLDIDLNHKEWRPIGFNHQIKKCSINGEKYVRVIPNTPFKGTFDGCGHTIYGLRISEYKNGKYLGLFGDIVDATIKNIVFEQVRIGALEEDTSFAAVCGYAESSMFSNIIVSGTIHGESCSSIACISVDTSFYNCINRANLGCRSDSPNSKLLVGGIVQQVGLSEKMAEQSYTQSPDLFIKCIQAGTISVHIGETDQFIGGQIYGVIVPTADGYSFTINRCDGQIPMVIDGIINAKDNESVFCGVSSDNHPIWHMSSLIGNKIDLLNGLIGKTSTTLKVRVVNITRSIVIDKMVIQGSVNALESDYHTNTFRTIDISEIKSNDGIEVLEPYFTYVQTKNI